MTTSRTDQFQLSGAWNFRDVGGLRTDDGQTVRPGILFRSSQLVGLDTDGQSALTALGVADVFDLRGVREVERTGIDNLPDGIRLHSTPFDPSQGESEAAPHEAPRIESREAARAYMEKAYSEFPVLDGAHHAISTAIHTLAGSESAVLVNCAAGKDRAGWLTATILRAAGVTESDILTDYLRSNDAIAPLRSMLAAQYGDRPDLSDELLGVNEDYFHIALTTVDKQYGSFDGYLEAVGVGPETLTRLRARLLS